MSDRSLSLIGSIYDAIGEDDAVPHVMANVSAHLGAKVAFWYVVRRGASGDAALSPFLFDGSFGVHHNTVREFREEMWRHDYALRAASVTDRTTETHELISEKDLARSDYAHWISTSAGVDRRIGRSTDLGGGVVAGWAFHMPPGLARQPCERIEFDILAPHVRNLFRLTSRFGEHRAQREGLEQVINDQRQAVMLLTADGEVCWASDAADRLCARNDGMTTIARRIVFDRSTETRTFESLMQRALKPDPSKDNGHARMVAPRASGGFPYVIELSAAPARFQARVHSRAAVIMTVHDPDGAVDGRPDVWREMFNLTPAEARVAMLTMRGMSDEAIASELQIGVGTVRTHQKQLLAKTETHSKAELAHLLTRIG